MGRVVPHFACKCVPLLVVALRNGMIRGMTTVKRAVTIDEELEREARALAGENFSAFVSEAVSRHVRRLKLERLVQADEAERGSVDPEAEAQVEAELAALDRDHEAVQAQPE
jgi:post-segregation antitoxin (ccd killing protein)